MNNYHHGNLKEELIDCACRLCDRDGYTKLSIRSLAKESGVSQTAPYRHFETKECVYAAVAAVGFKKLNELVFFDSPKKITKTKLVANASKYIEFGLKNANTYDLMFGTAVGNFADYPDLLKSANETYDNMKDSFASLADDSEQVIAGTRLVVPCLYRAPHQCRSLVPGRAWDVWLRTEVRLAKRASSLAQARVGSEAPQEAPHTAPLR